MDLSREEVWSSARRVMIRYWFSCIRRESMVCQELLGLVPDRLILEAAEFVKGLEEFVSLGDLEDIE